ncbi:MAG: DUF2807 domain-containing protein [Prevotellaceae bacterium]|jgi:hypothetical protein|nr:DUF2807 domain-containing protein [Prevotellaceae bacterium]
MKKMIFATLALALLGSSNAAAQGGLFGGLSNKKVVGSNTYVTKEFYVGEFTGLSVGGSLNVTYTQQKGKPRVEVHTSDNLVDLLDIRIKDGTLHIGFKKGYYISYKKLDVQVFGDALSNLNLAGSGNLILKNGLDTRQPLAVSLAGSGDIIGGDIFSTNLSLSLAGSGTTKLSKLECTQLKLSLTGSGNILLQEVTSTSTSTSIAGSGNITLTGTSNSALYKITGSGDVFASDYVVDSIETSITGSGDIKCHAVKKLKVRTSGSGQVGYKGSPEIDYPQRGLYKL